MHQANLRINEAVQKKLGEAKKEGKIKKGNLICFVALGSGLHWGALLYKA